jgi:mannosyltransferase OCH1-like enzyme
MLHRVIPADPGPEAERYWEHAGRLHPRWMRASWQDDIPSDAFPITAAHWARCTSGAQRAGLVRLEALYHFGGFYLDADWEPYRPLDSLLGAAFVAGWEDSATVPDAVIGAAPGHPLLARAIDLAISRLDQGAWASGPGVLTELLPGRRDVLLLPPGSFYPYHYTQRHRKGEDHAGAQPWAFGAHHWAASWLR